MSSPEFAVSTHLYHDRRLSRAHLREIASHGFEAIELFANRPHFPYEDERMIEELEEGLRETGLRLHSIHAPIAEFLKGGRWSGAYSIATTLEQDRAHALREIETALAIARRVETDYLVVHLGVPDSQRQAPGDNRADATRRSLEALHAVTEPLGVQLALEVMPNRLSSPEQLVSLIESDLDLPAVGVCLDFGHAHLMGDVVDAIETVSGHLVTTHLHDNDGRADDHRLPFEGGIQWEPVLMALQKIGYDGALVFEPAGTATPTETLARARHVRTRFESFLRSSEL